MADSLQLTVDRAAFLEVARVFKRVYRPNGAANVIITLGHRCLRIAFEGGGSKLACDTDQTLVAHLTAKAFAGLITPYRTDKSPVGTIALTFRPTLGEIATPLSRAK